jgi:hypothetical protein
VAKGVPVTVWVEVGVPVGREVDVSEGARVCVLPRVGTNVGVSAWEERAIPLHPVKTMSTRTEIRNRIFTLRFELYNDTPPEIITARQCGCNRPIIYRKKGLLG